MSRFSLVLLTMFALLMASLGGAMPMNSSAMDAAESGSGLGWASMLLQATVSGSPAGGMAGGANPWHECSHFEAVLSAVGINSGCRSGLSDDSLPNCLSVASITPVRRSLCATPGSVSSSLGRQFTLVGAKPSGTS